MRRIYSYITYFALILTFLLTGISLFIINRIDQQSLPIDGLIALDVFLSLVICLLACASFKLKRVYLVKDGVDIRNLFSNKTTIVPFDNVIEMKNLLPSYIDPINCRLIFFDSFGGKRKVYFIKSLKLIAYKDLGIAMGIVKPK